MSILLPAAPLPLSAAPHFIDYGDDVKSPLGGPNQRANRLGSRSALVITTPRLKPEPDGRIWSARLIRAKRLGALYPWPQPGLVIGNPGAPVVNGGGQAGLTLSLRGFAPNYPVREGQAFNIIHGGRRYLHIAGADTVANGAGVMLLPIEPMLRISPSDGALCDFAQPLIEGTLSGNEVAWEQVRARTQSLSFTITECE